MMLFGFISNFCFPGFPLSYKGFCLCFGRNKNSGKTVARARNTPFGAWREALTCSYSGFFEILD